MVGLRSLSMDIRVLLRLLDTLRALLQISDTSALGPKSNLPRRKPPTMALVQNRQFRTDLHLTLPTLAPSLQVARSCSNSHLRLTPISPSTTGPSLHTITPRS
jgi:hypothetical protein